MVNICCEHFFIYWFSNINCILCCPYLFNYLLNTQRNLLRWLRHLLFESSTKHTNLLNILRKKKCIAWQRDTSRKKLRHFHIKHKIRSTLTRKTSTDTIHRQLFLVMLLPLLNSLKRNNNFTKHRRRSCTISISIDLDSPPNTHIVINAFFQRH